MSVYHCRTMHYLLTATTRCISFGRQLLYMKGYDGRPLGHVVFRQLFLFSPPSISHPFYANIRANIRRYKRGVNNFWTIVFLSFVIGLYIYCIKIMYRIYLPTSYKSDLSIGPAIEPSGQSVNAL